MARVVVLGGCGGMAKYAVRFLLLDRYRHLISHLVVADINSVAAQRFVDELKDDRVTAKSVDISDTPSLSNLLEGCDVLANFVGPFYKFASTVIKAALQAKCHYLDIMDDTVPTLFALDYDDQMKQAGKTAIIGIGASPGITNILALFAMEKLDKGSATDVVIAWGDGFDAINKPIPPPKNTRRIGWYEWMVRGIYEAAAIAKAFYMKLAGKTPLAVTYHFIEMIRGDVQTWKDGKQTTVPALTQVPGLFFPNVDYSFNSYYVGHPENVTIGHAFPNLQSTCNLLSLPSSDIQSLKTDMLKPINEGSMSIETAAFLFQEVENVKRSFENAEGRGKYLNDGLLPVEGELLALVKGKKDGKVAVAGAGLARSAHNLRATLGELDQLSKLRTLDLGHADSEDYKDMGSITGGPLAVAIIMLLRNQITATGVMFPEMCIDPKVFLAEFGSLFTPALNIDAVAVSDVEVDTERVKNFPFNNTKAKI